jgi:outer membrane protein assembly factor BamB
MQRSAWCFLLFLATLVGMPLAVRSETPGNWTEFRGPTGQGLVSESEGTLPLAWSPTENVAWKTELSGQGWSSPVIWGDQIWVTTALDEGHRLHALCIDRASGKLLHDVEVFRVQQPQIVNLKNSQASPTPVIEEGRVYVHFGAYGTACLDTASGRVLWTNRDLVIDHEVGPGSSPTLFDDLLLINFDGYDLRYVVAMDKRTGEIAWKTDRSGVIEGKGTIKKAFSTPLVVNMNGRTQAISPGAKRVISYEPRTGEEQWFVRYDGYSNVPRPIVGCGMVFIVTGFPKAELIAVQANGTGDVTDTHVTWRVKQQVPTIPSPVLVGMNLFMVSDKGVASCLNAFTGEEQWKERLGGNYAASPIAANGRIYFINEDGETHVVAATPEYKLLASNDLDQRTLASPAVSSGAIFIRTMSHLYCIRDDAQSE